MPSENTRGKLLAAVLSVVMILSVVTLITLPAGAASSTEVSLSPSSAQVDVSNTTTFDVVVENADGGVGAHSTTVTLGDSSVAEITDVELAGDPGQEDVNVSADNSSVSISAALMDTDDTGAVTIATITVEGMNNGSTGVALSVDALGDEIGESYTVTGTNDATLTVGSSESGGTATDTPTSTDTAVPTDTAAPTDTDAPTDATSQTAVSLSPDTTQVDVSNTATFDVVVENANGGVGAYTTAVTLEDSSVAEITDVELAGDPGQEDVNVSGDNSTVSISAALMDTDDTGAVTIATITVEGMNNGSTGVALSVDALGDEIGESYTVTGTNDASLTVGSTESGGTATDTPTSTDTDTAVPTDTAAPTDTTGPIDNDTPADTDVPTGTGPPTNTSISTGQPGFGAGVALAALIAVILVVRRRD